MPWLVQCPTHYGPGPGTETRQTLKFQHRHHQTSVALDPATPKYWQSRLTPTTTVGLTGYRVSSQPVPVPGQYRHPSLQSETDQLKNHLTWCLTHTGSRFVLETRQC